MITIIIIVIAIYLGFGFAVGALLSSSAGEKIVFKDLLKFAIIYPYIFIRSKLR